MRRRKFYIMPAPRLQCPPLCTWNLQPFSVIPPLNMVCPLQSICHVAAGVFILKSVISTACSDGPCSVKVHVPELVFLSPRLVPDISPQFFLYSTHLTKAAIMSHWPVPEWARPLKSLSVRRETWHKYFHLNFLQEVHR